MIKIGIIGKFDEEFIPHKATMDSLRHSSKKVGVDISIDWIDTESINFYDRSLIREQDVCSFEINQEYLDEIESNGLIIKGIDSENMPRIVEYSKNDFYLGTLFVPQLNSTIEFPHPIVTGFLKVIKKNMK